MAICKICSEAAKYSVPITAASTADYCQAHLPKIHRATATRGGYPAPVEPVVEAPAAPKKKSTKVAEEPVEEPAPTPEEVAVESAHEDN